MEFAETYDLAKDNSHPRKVEAAFPTITSYGRNKDVRIHNCPTPNDVAIVQQPPSPKYLVASPSALPRILESRHEAFTTALVDGEYNAHNSSDISLGREPPCDKTEGWKGNEHIVERFTETGADDEDIYIFSKSSQDPEIGPADILSDDDLITMPIGCTSDGYNANGDPVIQHPDGSTSLFIGGRCGVSKCTYNRWRPLAALVIHEQEAHRVAEHSQAQIYCTVESCERSLPKNGFAGPWNLLDHNIRIHRSWTKTAMDESRSNTPVSMKPDPRETKHGIFTLDGRGAITGRHIKKPLNGAVNIFPALDGAAGENPFISRITSGPYYCKMAGCDDPWPTVSALRIHEGESHALYGDVTHCVQNGCERSLLGNGFPIQWSFLDHMKNVHGYDYRSRRNLTSLIDPMLSSPNSSHIQEQADFVQISNTHGDSWVVGVKGLKSSASVGFPKDRDIEWGPIGFPTDSDRNHARGNNGIEPLSSDTAWDRTADGKQQDHGEFSESRGLTTEMGTQKTMKEIVDSYSFDQYKLPERHIKDTSQAADLELQNDSSASSLSGVLTCDSSSCSETHASVTSNYHYGENSKSHVQKHILSLSSHSTNSKNEAAIGAGTSEQRPDLDHGNETAPQSNSTNSARAHSNMAATDLESFESKNFHSSQAAVTFTSTSTLRLGDKLSESVRSQFVQHTTSETSNTPSDIVSEQEKSVAQNGTQISRVFSHTEYPNHEMVPFTTIKQLGHGSLGSVDSVYQDSDNPGIPLARKVILLRNTARRRLLPLLQQEVAILRGLTHKHIVKVVCTYETTSVPRQFGILISPSGDEDLGHFLERVAENDFPGEDITILESWPHCLASAVAYIHSQNIRHKDIKPSNIIRKDNEIYLTDFGSAYQFIAGLTSSTEGYAVGVTRMYCAPEVIALDRRGRSADIYSLGCVFAEMLTVVGRRRIEDFHDFRSQPVPEEPDRTTICYYATAHKLEEWFMTQEDSWIFSLVSRMMANDKALRPSAKEAMKIISEYSGPQSCTCSTEFDNLELGKPIPGISEKTAV
jgi:hypothetical protein